MSTSLIESDVIEEERAFELAQRKAKVYASSTLVPKEYQNNIGNVLIAMNMAKRMNADPLMVMQNLYIVHGKPGWSSAFLIACLNSCGRFSAIKYRFGGTQGKPTWACTAYVTEIATGDVVEGPTVSIEMANAEGWASKNGSKWKTMPELMLRYRAAAFLIRSTAPEIGMGIMTAEELSESNTVVASPRPATSLVLDAIAPKGITHSEQPHDYTADLESSVTFSDLTALRATIDLDDTIPAEERGQLLLDIDDRLAVMGEEAGGGR
jgi:hypothetical protein